MAEDETNGTPVPAELRPLKVGNAEIMALPAPEGMLLGFDLRIRIAESRSSSEQARAVERVYLDAIQKLVPDEQHQERLVDELCDGNVDTTGLLSLLLGGEPKNRAERRSAAKSSTAQRRPSKPKAPRR
jgi:hypothetical protein